METSFVRQRVMQTIDRARRTAAQRRQKTEEAARAYDEFLQRVATPLLKQVAGALKASGHPFGVFTPGGAVRLSSEKASQDYIEISLDNSGDEPVVLGRVSRARGRRIIETEQPIATGPIGELTEEQLLEFLLKELERFVAP
jgi:hypothetical protein